MALPKHVRERLRLHALKNKGRTNLTGLDRNVGLVAIDYVMEHCEDAIKRWGLRADGTLRYNSLPGEEFGRYLSAKSCRTHYDEGKAVPNRYFVHCPWVRLGYTADWIKDELALRWPRRFISFSVRGAIKHDRVFPVGVACEFLRFLWPAREDFYPRAEKYVNGYSKGYVQRHPGIGATVELLKDVMGLRAGLRGQVTRTTHTALFVQLDDSVEVSLTPHMNGVYWHVVG